MSPRIKQTFADKLLSTAFPSQMPEFARCKSTGSVIQLKYRTLCPDINGYMISFDSKPSVETNFAPPKQWTQLDRAKRSVLRKTNLVSRSRSGGSSWASPSTKSRSAHSSVLRRRRPGQDSNRSRHAKRSQSIVVAPLEYRGCFSRRRYKCLLRPTETSAFY
jgi:hypothetical protein